MKRAMNDVDLLAKLKAVPVLKDLDSETIARLKEGTSFVRLESGENLFHAGDEAGCCYVISFGSVKLLRSAGGGREVVMCFLRAGDFVGAAVLTHTQPRYPLTAVALEDCGLIQIPRNVFLSAWQQIPSLAREINIGLTGRLIEFQEDKALSASPVPAKVASFLLRTLDAQGAGFGTTINLRLTRRDIAERVGSSVETVIRIMSAWSQKGWIKTDDHRVSVENRKALESLIRENE